MASRFCRKRLVWSMTSWRFLSSPYRIDELYLKEKFLYVPHCSRNCRGFIDFGVGGRADRNLADRSESFVSSICRKASGRIDRPRRIHKGQRLGNLRCGGSKQKF